MKSLINSIKENGSGKEEAVEEVSSNIEEACCEDELYELPLETLTDILSHTREVDYKTAHTILTKATAKYGKRSVNVLSSLHVDEGLSELELETLLSLIPGIQIFTLLGSFTKKVEVDYEETIENERNLRKNLETEVEMKKKELEFFANEVNELRLQKELAKLKEMEDSSTKIEQKLETFNLFNQKSRKNRIFRDELQQEINVKPKEFEESIAKAKNCVSELQRIVNESNKTIKTYEKSQKTFSKLVPKLQKKFNEINSN